MKRRFIEASLLLLSVALVITSQSWASQGWLSKVPAADRARVNPYAGNAEAAAAGKLIFEDNCAKCHGDDAEGRHGRPSLRSQRVAHATDGELAWILRNGQAFHGMPSWSSLPEQQRWQIITFLRTLPTDSKSYTR
jgi:mono/diheme cytochrome c family protein